MIQQRFVVIDVETTGNSPAKGDKIIQLAAVVLENGKIVERFSSFINPKKEIPVFIEQLTGITNDIVKDAPVFSEIADKVSQLLDQAYFVAHNVLFDLSFVQAELAQAGYNTINVKKIDTVELARIIMPTLSSYKLNQLAKSLSLSHKNPHQADSDAEVTAEVLLILFEKLQALPFVTLRRFQKFVQFLYSDLDEIFANILQEKSASLSEDDKFFDFYKDLAIKKKQEIDDRKKVIYSVSRTKILENMQKELPNYEHRHGQIEMMEIIDEAFEWNQHAIVEAATGIGKTLGYLIPSILHAKKTMKPVVISTYTLQLQQQIYEQDGSILQKLCPFPIDIVMMKGRKNYIHLQRFQDEIDNGDYNYDTVLTILQIMVWLTQTETGDMDELNIPSGGQIFCEKINSTVEYYDDQIRHNEKFDFYYRAKEKAKKADLIITNHSLLFSETFGESQSLPPFDTVILDEAHHIESVVSKYLGAKVSYLMILHQITRLGTLDQSKHGLVKNILAIFEKYHIPCEDSLYKMDEILKMLLLDVNDLFRLIRMYALKKKKNRTLTRISYRYELVKEKGRTWNSIIELLLRIRMQLTDVCNEIKRQEAVASQYQRDFNEMDRNELAVYFSNQLVFEQIKTHLNELFFQQNKQMVTWIETDEKGAQNSATVMSQHIDVSELLAQSFFAKKKSVILTSATLAIEGDFSYFIQQLGLEYFYPKCMSILSPFLYKKCAKLMVPTDLPTVNQVPTDEYVASISAHIEKIALQVQGRMLVLFTSYEMLKATYEELKHHSQLEDFVIIGQGISGGSRTKLAKSFQQFQKSILLGTNSFWEGVDLQDESISCLIIVRLPFASPDEPIFEAKSQHIKEQGGNAFNDLSLPQAILRFKQGFGRLIRKDKDKGIVFIFDKRIVTKWYGEKFIQSLPDIDVHYEPLSKLLSVLNEWL